MHDISAVQVKVETLLPNRCCRQYEWPERGIERLAHRCLAGGSVLRRLLWCLAGRSGLRCLRWWGIVTERHRKIHWPLGPLLLDAPARSHGNVDVRGARTQSQDSTDVLCAFRDIFPAEDTAEKISVFVDHRLEMGVKAVTEHLVSIATRTRMLPHAFLHVSLVEVGAETLEADTGDWRQYLSNAFTKHRTDGPQQAHGWRRKHNRDKVPHHAFREFQVFLRRLRPRFDRSHERLSLQRFARIRPGLNRLFEDVVYLGQYPFAGLEVSVRLIEEIPPLQLKKGRPEPLSTGLLGNLNSCFFEELL